MDSTIYGAVVNIFIYIFIYIYIIYIFYLYILFIYFINIFYIYILYINVYTYIYVLVLQLYPQFEGVNRPKFSTPNAVLVSVLGAVGIYLLTMLSCSHLLFFWEGGQGIYDRSFLQPKWIFMDVNEVFRLKS